MTHTYAIAEVSQSAYDEIRAVLVAAGYQHAIHDNSDGEVLDMHGIGLRAKAGSDERMVPGRFVPGRWFRIMDPDGDLWMETSDEAEARAEALRTNWPLEQQFATQPESEWRRV